MPAPASSPSASNSPAAGSLAPPSPTSPGSSHTSPPPPGAVAGTAPSLAAISFLKLSAPEPLRWRGEQILAVSPLHRSGEGSGVGLSSSSLLDVKQLEHRLLHDQQQSPKHQQHAEARE